MLGWRPERVKAAKASLPRGATPTEGTRNRFAGRDVGGCRCTRTQDSLRTTRQAERQERDEGEHRRRDESVPGRWLGRRRPGAPCAVADADRSRSTRDRDDAAAG